MQLPANRPPMTSPNASIRENLMVGTVGLLPWLWSATVPFTLFVFFFALYRVIQPRKLHSAIYLRAFKQDSKGHEFRRFLRLALGDDYRLTGIRPPSRRVPRWALAPFFAFLAVRYGSSRFMDLEAEADWLVRLARTCARVRVVVIDLREITPFVHHEMRVMVEAVGWQRILFIGDSSQPVSHWISEIRKAVPDASPDLPMHLVLDQPDRRLLAGEIRQFMEQLPTALPGDNPRAEILAERLVPAAPTPRWLRVCSESSAYWLITGSVFLMLAVTVVNRQLGKADRWGSTRDRAIALRDEVVRAQLAGENVAEKIRAFSGRPRGSKPVLPALLVMLNLSFMGWAWVARIGETISELRIARRWMDKVSARFVWRRLALCLGPLFALVVPFAIVACIMLLVFTLKLIA